MAQHSRSTTFPPQASTARDPRPKVPGERSAWCVRSVLRHHTVAKKPLVRLSRLAVTLHEVRVVTHWSQGSLHLGQSGPMAGAVWLALVLVDVGLMTYGRWVQNKALRSGDDARARGGSMVTLIAFVALLGLIASGFLFVFPD